MNIPRWLSVALVMLACLGIYRVASAHGDNPPPPDQLPPVQVNGAGVHAACAGGPVIDGITLDECITRNFTVGGVGKAIRVWYTKNTTTANRTEDGVDYTLEHWINSDAEAQQVAEWFEEAWQRFFADSGHHLYDNGCGNMVNVQMEDGIGWSGIAYWGNPGDCWIGIDSPMVRNGGGQWTVYHEAQHYLQYSYDAGCYGFLRPNYPDDSEFVEGYADLGADSVDAALDAMGYGGITYDPSTSMYDKSYGNIFNKYFIEQLGTIGAPTDPWHRMDALYAHYTECDNQNTLYVLNTLIPTLSSGKWSEREFFLNFFAANWAKDWADPATQPELVYLDDDGNAYGNLASLTQNINMGGGSQSFPDVTPDDWAAKYYQVTPQAGCPYLQMEVDGASGAQLGINFLAAKTSAPTRVLRSAKIGEDFVRTFAANGIHNRLAAAVNSFSSNYNYTVNFTCVTPTLNILEPRQVKFALVGDPASPIAFLARWSVTDGASPIRGLQESSFTFDAAGDAITVVPGTFQEVGNEYWAVLLPPVKPAGTTFVDFRVTLDGSISDSETDALLYVAPGNSDIALSFDASGSMDEEDVTGEGTRLTNAKRAGQVVADLLRVGDRIAVLDWSAFDNPPGCGAPGDGNCPLDLRTLLPRTDLDAATLAAVIGIARAQIGNISAREWTPVGAGIEAAQNELLKAPTNTNPKHIFLLSDGEENVKPFYSDIKPGLLDSGVVVNTIAFGPDAPGNLMAQIAADTGGIYRPVATSGSGAGVMAASTSAVAAFDALNLPVDASAVMAASYLPGQLGLANVYDYFDTEAQGAARVINMNYTDVPAFDAPNSVKEMAIIVDKSVNQLRLVVAGKQPDDEGCTVSDIRKVDVLMPGMDPQKDRWLPISPPLKSVTPADWDIRNNRFDDVLVVTDPAPGVWHFRTYYYPNNCIGAAATTADGSLTGDVTVAAPTATDGADAVALGAPYAFIMNVSVQSTIQLEGRLLGLTANQGEAGDEVTIVGTLLDKNGTLPAALIAALVEGPVGNTLLVLKDDGANNDGVAGDNIYAARFAQTTYGGSYSVRILAYFKDPADPANLLWREWNGGFWIKGPKPDQQCGSEKDTDKDCMPDDWERRCKLIVGQDDRRADPDNDGLSNYDELQLGTLPCRADTDNGGENDGSEVRNQRNPLDPKDDKVREIGKIRVRPLNSLLMIDWSYPLSYTNMVGYISTDVNKLGNALSLGQKGNFPVGGLANDTTYYIRLQGVNGDAVGDLSDPVAVMPKADPDMPSGTLLIENGKAVATSKQVVLHISATDQVLDGAAQGAAAHQTDMLSQIINQVSGGVQMRISNHADMRGAVWEWVTGATKNWTLDCNSGETCTVYAQFKDAAQNESLIVNDTIELDVDTGGEVGFDLFLPVVTR